MMLLVNLVKNPYARPCRRRTRKSSRCHPAPTDVAVDGPRSRVFEGAENRLHAWKALMDFVAQFGREERDLWFRQGREREGNRGFLDDGSSRPRVVRALRLRRVGEMGARPNPLAPCGFVLR